MIKLNADGATFRRKQNSMTSMPATIIGTSLSHIQAKGGAPMKSDGKCKCGHGHDDHCYSDGTLKPWCDICPCKAYEEAHEE